MTTTNTLLSAPTTKILLSLLALQRKHKNKLLRNSQSFSSTFDAAAVVWCMRSNQVDHKLSGSRVLYIFFFHFHCSRSYINSLLHAFHSFLSSICNNDCCWLNLTCMESSSIIHDTHQCWQHLGTLSPRFSEFGPTHVWIRTICLVLRHSCFPNNRHLHNLRGKICMRINVS